MNFFLKLLGYRPRTYRGDGFSVEIESKVREGVSVIYERGATKLELTGERTGRKWEAIAISVPDEVEMAHASQIARDLESAFRSMGYQYAITRGLETLARSK